MSTPSIKLVASTQQPAETVASPAYMGRVLELLASGQHLLQVGAKTLTAELAAHVGCVFPGQQVMVVSVAGMPPLVIAAYRLSSSAATDDPQGRPPMRFDADSGTLVIEANQLRLEGLSALELRSGDAVFRLTVQGEIVSQAQSITQAAIGAHRIEGASIDLN